MTRLGNTALVKIKVTHSIGSKYMYFLVNVCVCVCVCVCGGGGGGVGGCCLLWSSRNFCAPPFPPCKGLDIHRGGGDLEDQTVKQVNLNEASLEFPLWVEGFRHYNIRHNLEA